MNNLNEITTYLVEDSRSQAEKIIENANIKAKSIIQHMVDKGMKEKPVIIKKYEKKAKEETEIFTLKNNMDRHRILLLTKQELVDKTIQKVRYKFENQSVSEWIKCMRMLIEQGKKETDELPTILVPNDYLEETKEAFGNDYNVMSHDIQSGFILSYSKFDLNYEVEHFFNYQNEELDVAAFELLFGD